MKSVRERLTWKEQMADGNAMPTVQVKPRVSSTASHSADRCCRLEDTVLCYFRSRWSLAASGTSVHVPVYGTEVQLQRVRRSRGRQRTLIKSFQSSQTCQVVQSSRVTVPGKTAGDGAGTRSVRARAGDSHGARHRHTPGKASPGHSALQVRIHAPYHNSGVGSFGPEG